MIQLLLALSFLFLSPSSLLAKPQASKSHLVYMYEDDAGKRIVLTDANGDHPQVISPEGSWGLYPDIANDGSAVVFSSGTDEQHLGIVVRNLYRGVTEHWTPQDGQYLHSDFSGNGRYLAFSGPVGAQRAQRIAIVDLTIERAQAEVPRTGDSEVTYRPRLKVVNSDYPAYFPALSSSGAFLVYQRSKGATKDIVWRDLITEEEKNLTPEDGYAMAPSLSFDDRYVAYTAKVNGVWDIFIRDLWSDDVKQITATAYLDYAPVFRADGSLVYAADMNGHFELFEIPAAAMRDGTYLMQPLVVGVGDHYAPSVSGEVGPEQFLQPKIPEPARSSFGAIAHEGKVYVVGGHQGPEHTYPAESFMDRVDIFNQVTATWTQGASLSLARHGFSLAARGNYIYAFGGFTYSSEHTPGWKSVDLIERYDIQRNEWQVIGHLEKPRSSNAVATVNGKVYLIGGWDSTPQAPDDADGRFHDTIEVFDLATESISTLPTRLPTPLRRALSSVAYGNEVILVGGIGVGADHFNLLQSVTAFDTVTATWHDLPSLPFATFAPATGIIDDELFVFGGMFKTGEMSYEYVDHIYGLKGLNRRFGPSSQTPQVGPWRHIGRYVSELKGFSQVVDLGSNTLGILGGHTYEGDEDHPVTTFETFRVLPSQAF